MSANFTIEVDPSFDSGDLKPIFEIAKITRSKIEINTRKGGEVYEANEWIIPAAVVLYFSKPFFDSLLRQLGTATGKAIARFLAQQFAISKKKDSRSYKLPELAKGLKKARKKGLSAAERWRLIHTLGKPVAPLELKIGDKNLGRARLMFPSELSESEFESALEDLCSMRKELFQLRQLRLDLEEISFIHARTFVFVRGSGWKTLEELEAAARAKAKRRQKTAKSLRRTKISRNRFKADSSEL